MSQPAGGSTAAAKPQAPGVQEAEKALHGADEAVTALGQTTSAYRDDKDGVDAADVLAGAAAAHVELQRVLDGVRL